MVWDKTYKTEKKIWGEKSFTFSRIRLYLFNPEYPV